MPGEKPIPSLKEIDDWNDLLKFYDKAVTQKKFTYKKGDEEVTVDVPNREALDHGDLSKLIYEEYIRQHPDFKYDKNSFIKKMQGYYGAIQSNPDTKNLQHAGMTAVPYDPSVLSGKDAWIGSLTSQYYVPTRTETIENDNGLNGYTKSAIDPYSTTGDYYKVLESDLKDAKGNKVDADEAFLTRIANGKVIEGELDKYKGPNTVSATKDIGLGGSFSGMPEGYLETIAKDIEEGKSDKPVKPGLKVDSPDTPTGTGPAKVDDGTGTEGRTEKTLDPNMKSDWVVQDNKLIDRNAPQIYGREDIYDISPEPLKSTEAKGGQTITVGEDKYLFGTDSDSKKAYKITKVYKCGGKIYLMGGPMHIPSKKQNNPGFYEDGGDFDDANFEVVGGGNLHEIADDIYLAKGKSHKEGGIDIEAGGEDHEIQDGEVVHFKDNIARVISNVRKNPETGNVYSEDYKKIAQEVSKLSSSERDYDKGKVKELLDKLDAIWEKHEATRVDDGDNKKPEGGPIYIYNKKSDRLVTINDPEMANQFKSKLGEGNYEEYSTVKPDGFVSKERYFGKEGKFARVTPRFEGQVEQSEAYKGATELYPVTTGQKKNKQVPVSDKSSTYEWTGPTTGGDATGGPGTNPLTAAVDQFGLPLASSKLPEGLDTVKESQDYWSKLEKEVEKFGGYDLFIYSNSIDFEKDLLGFHKFDEQSKNKPYSAWKLHGMKGTLEYKQLLEAAWTLRKKDNAVIGDEVIEFIKPIEEKLVSDYEHDALSRGVMGAPDPYGQLPNLGVFRDELDKRLSGKVKLSSGREVDFDNMNVGQKEEIRNYVILNYNLKKNVKTAIDKAEWIIHDPEADKERYHLQKATGVDVTKLKSGDKWVEILTEFGKKSDEISKEYADKASKIPLSIDIDKQSILTDRDEEVNDLNLKTTTYLQNLKDNLLSQVDQGLIDIQSANKMYEAEFETKVNEYDIAVNEVYTKYSRKANQMAQAKIDAATEMLKGEWESKITELAKQYGLSDMTSDEILENAANYTKLVQGLYVQKQSNDQLWLEDYAKRHADFKDKMGDDWGRISEALTKGTVQMFEMIGGGMSWLGGFEAGNRLSDMWDEYNAENPQMRIDWDGGAALLNKDWWIEKAVPMIPLTTSLLATSLIPGAGASAIATSAGLQGVAKVAFTGVIGGATSRFFEAFLEGGSEFRSSLDRGFDIEKASERAANVAGNNMWLIFLDAIQIGTAFSKIGKLSGIKSALVKAPIEFTSNYVEEVGQEYIVSKLDNPLLTIMKYATSGAGIETGMLGGITGLGFTLPDFVSFSNEDAHQNGVIVNALSNGELDKRVKDMHGTVDILFARGMMDEDELNFAKAKIDHIALLLKDIPPSLDNTIKTAAINQLDFIENARKASLASTTDSMKKFYDGQVKEGEKLLDQILTGQAPMYFIGSTSYSKEKFIEAINNPENVEKLIEQGTKVAVINDDAVLKSVNDLFTTVAPNPEEMAQKEKNYRAGKMLFSEPVKEVAEVSRRYREKKGITGPSGERITGLDENKSMKIADAYEDMKHDPNNPEVKEAYQAMADETKDQFKEIVDAGYEIELWDGEGEPYANSQEMLDDLRNNKHMYVFSTEAGYGQEAITDEQRSENPLLVQTEYTDKNGKPLVVNDLFRFVHDFFGHSERGNSFGAIGEENAWDVHARMYSPKARRAMTTETRGQNSWVNFGPQMRGPEGKILKKGDPGYLGPKERQFAEQKIGLLPEEFSTIEGFDQASEPVTEKVDKPEPKILSVNPSMGRESGRPGKALLEKIKKGAPNIKIEEKITEELKSSPSVILFTKRDGKIYGLYDKKTGVIQLDIDEVKEGDVIEEFAHLWLRALKKNKKAVYKKALLAISGQKYYDNVKADPDYAGATEQDIREEALAKAIADNGLELTERTWFQELIAAIKKFISNIFGVNEITLNNFSLDSLVKGAATELMNFKPWTEATSEEFVSGNTQITNRSIIHTPKAPDEQTIFNKTKESAKGIYIKYFTQTKGSSQSAAELKSGYSASIEAEKSHITQFFKNISGPKLARYLKGLKAKELSDAVRIMNDYLNGEIDLVNVPAEFQQTLRELRAEIDAYSERILGEFDPNDIIVGVDANLDLYLTNNYQAQKEIDAAEWEKNNREEMEDIMDDIDGLFGNEMRDKLVMHLDRLSQDVNQLETQAKALIIKQLKDKVEVLKQSQSRPAQRLLKALDKVIGNYENNKFGNISTGDIGIVTDLYKNLNLLTDAIRQELSEIDNMTEEEKAIAELISDANNLLQADTSFDFKNGDDAMNRILFNVVQDKLIAKGIIEKRIALAKYDNNIVVNVQSTKIEDDYLITVTHKDGSIQSFKDLSISDIKILFGESIANEIAKRDSNIDVPEKAMLIPTNNKLYQSIINNKGSYVTGSYLAFEKPDHWVNNWRYELKKRFDENGISLYDRAVAFMRKKISEPIISGMTIQKKGDQVMITMSNQYGISAGSVKNGKVSDQIILPLKSDTEMSFQDLKESNGGFIDDVEFNDIMNIIENSNQEIKFGTLADSKNSNGTHFPGYLSGGRRQIDFKMLTTEEDVDNYMESNVIRNAQANFLKGSSEFNQFNGDVFKKKQDIPEEIRFLLGEITDPVLSVQKTLVSQAVALQSMHFFNRMAKENGLFTDKPTGMISGYVMSQAEYTSTHGNKNPETVGMVKIDGDNIIFASGKNKGPIYMTKEAADLLQITADKPNQFSGMVGGMFQGYYALSGIMGFNYTAGNLGGASRNTLSSLLIYLRSGALDPVDIVKSAAKGKAPKMVTQPLEATAIVFAPFYQSKSKLWTGLKVAFGTVTNAPAMALHGMSKAINKRSMEELLEEHNRLVRLGVISGNVELESLKEVSGATKLTDFLFNNKFSKTAGDYYSVGDDIGRAAVFYQNYNELKEANEWNKENGKLFLSDEAIEVQAANIAKKIYPTYSMLPTFYQEISRLPVVGAKFSRFVASMYITSLNTFKIGADQISSKNPVLKRAGMKKLGSFTTMALVFPAIAAAAFSAYGWDRRKYLAWNRLQPGYKKNAIPIFLSGPGNTVQYIDLSFIDPSSQFHKVIMSGLNSKSFGQGVMNMAKANIDPFIFNDIVTNVLAEISANENSYGIDIYHKHDDIDDSYFDMAMVKSFMYGLKKVVAPQLGTVETFKKSIKGETGSAGQEYSLPLFLMSVGAGVRTRKENYDIMFKNKMIKHNQKFVEQGELNPQLKKYITSGGKKGYSEKEYISIAKPIFDNAVRDIEDYLELGVPADKIYKMLLDARIPKGTESVGGFTLKSLGFKIGWVDGRFLGWEKPKEFVPKKIEVN